MNFGLSDVDIDDGAPPAGSWAIMVAIFSKNTTTSSGDWA